MSSVFCNILINFIVKTYVDQIYIKVCRFKWEYNGLAHVCSLNEREIPYLGDNISTLPLMSYTIFVDYHPITFYLSFFKTSNVTGFVK